VGTLLPAFVLLATGMGLTLVPLSIAAFAGVGNHDFGVASGLFNTTQQIGGAVGVALLSTVAYAHLRHASTRNPATVVGAADAAAFRTGLVLIVFSLAIAASVIAADQASKAFVLSRSWAAGSNAGFLSVRKVSMQRDPLMFYFTPRTHVGLWIASIAIAAVLVRAGMIAENARNAAAIGAALGGAAGNIADRLRHGAIVDFIAIGRWPLFNLADVAIVMGVGLLVLSYAKT